ncbi:MAG TPA: hypothetical protein PLU43_02440, partial [Lachnospiraceae bacterium]|nr:hypothetical protein [Lachnospiraceae bacterium]
MQTELINLKGIGPKTAASYHKLGIYSCKDLLYYYPRDYIKFEEPKPVCEEQLFKLCFFKAEIARQPLMRRAGKLQIVTAELLSGQTVISAVWFHMPYLTKSLTVGKTFVFKSVLQKKGNRYHVEQPLFYTEEQYEKLLHTLQPVYPLIKGISSQAVGKLVSQVLLQADISD